MEYRQCVRELEALGVFPDRPPSLAPVRDALEASGLLAGVDPDRVIIVAGTNGKGSTSACLEALFQAGGARTGLYTSPHLVETTERFRIAGKDVSPGAFVKAYVDSRSAIEEFRLSHFEALTLMAVRLFSHAKLDWWILEVGLGGLWDATNAIPHRRCVLTPIDFDHQNLLGSTLVEIAANKFGVVSRGAQVVYAPLAPELAALRAQVEADTASKWTERLPFACRVQSRQSGEPAFYLSLGGMETRLSLPGSRAAANAALAITAYEKFGFDSRPVRSALSEVRWPGRMQKLELPECPSPVYLSGDHNPQGIRSLLELLEAYSYRHVHFLAGIGRDKEAGEMLESLAAARDSRVYLTVTPFKGRDLLEFGAWRERAQGSWEDPVQALKEVTRLAQPGDLVVVTGSLYLVGAILGHFGK